MLHWRLILAAVAIVVVVGLAYVDFSCPWPGVVMLPLAFGAAWMCAGEVIGLFEKAAANRLLGHDGPIPIEEQKAIPSWFVVQWATMLVVATSSVPLLWRDYGVSWSIGRSGWLALGIVAGMIASIVYEMRQYDGRDSAVGVIATRVARSLLAIVYAGGLAGFLVQLRALGGGRWLDDGRWGMVALLSLIVVVKFNDTGAYFAGRAFGRHKMTPRLSPGKTWEGIMGGFLLSLVATIIFLGPVAEAMGCIAERSDWAWWTGTIVYCLLVGIAGVAGDLAVSLLKRDAGIKDSSRWMPGFGGFLDLLDSILLAAPVAYTLWILRVVGP